MMTSSKPTEMPEAKLENQPEWIASAKQLSDENMKTFRSASEYPELETVVAVNDNQ